jgi:hypothetical protein
VSLIKIGGANLMILVKGKSYACIINYLLDKRVLDKGFLDYWTKE